MKNALALRNGNEPKEKRRVPNSFLEYLGETFEIDNR